MLSREEVEEKTQGYTEREAVPELVYGVGRGAGLRRGDCEIRSEVVNEKKLSAKLVALLVERDGLSGGLVEEGVVGDRRLDLKAARVDDRLLAACDGGHGGGDGGRRTTLSSSEGAWKSRRKRERRRDGG